MTDKLRIVKDILKIVISILIISMFVKSCSKASMLDLTSNLRKIEAKGIVNTGFTDWFISTNNGYINSIQNDMNRSGYQGYAICKISSNSSYYPDRIVIVISNSSTITNRSNDTNNAQYNNWNISNGTMYMFKITGQTEIQGTLKMNSATFQYAYTELPINTRSLQLGAGEEFGQNIINPALDFVPTGERRYYSCRYTTCTKIKNK